MKYLSSVIICLCFAADCFPQTIDPGTTASYSADIDAYIQPYLEANVFSGSVLIAKDNEIVFEGFYGYSDFHKRTSNNMDTKFAIASISKKLTQAAILILNQQNKLSLHEPIDKYIKGLPFGKEINIDHLMTHKSGLVGDFDDFIRTQVTSEEMLETLRNMSLSFKPGTDAVYSNHGYRLLALIVEHVSGKSYRAFLNDHLFSPLGMTNSLSPIKVLNEATVATGHAPDGYLGIKKIEALNWGNKTGNGSILSTARDLLKFSNALNEKVLLNEKSIKYLTESRTFNNRQMTMWSGGAPGFSAEFHRYLDGNVTIIVLSNNYSTVSRLVATDLARIVFDEPYDLPSFRKDIPHNKELNAGFVGRYRWGKDFFAPGATTKILTKDGILYKESRGVSTALIPQSSHTFLDRMNWAVITFIKDKDAVTGFDWKYNGQSFKATKLSSWQLWPH